MDSPLLESQTRSQIDNFLTSPSNSLLLVGLPGVGKLTVAQYLCRTLIINPLIPGSNYLHIEPIDGLISIESIRSIVSFIKLKSTGDGDFNRCIIIDRAEAMNSAAQNTLLKTLEEPPMGTLIILCVDSIHSLLPTLISRLSTIQIQKISKKSLINHFISEGYSEKDVNLAALISDGRIGMAKSILSNKLDINLEVLTLAKELIGMNKSDRLVKINSLSKDRKDTINLVDSLINIAKASLNSSAEKNNIKSIQIWNKVLAESLQAREALMVNASQKLVLTKLFLAI